MNTRLLNSKRRSQAFQEFFAYSIGGENGTYIEIGAYKPVTKNNTFALETDVGWRGFSLELNTKWKQSWDECKERSNSICWADAITFDYVAELKRRGMPNRVNYLSCDIEPPDNTLRALQRVIEQGVEFDCITFEHDKANPATKDLPDHDPLVREYLTKRGYKVAVYDVYAGVPDYLFETWFVRDDIDFPEMSFDQWKTAMNLTR
jgi:hypothetical protein